MGCFFFPSKKPKWRIYFMYQHCPTPHASKQKVSLFDKATCPLLQFKHPREVENPRKPSTYPVFSIATKENPVSTMIKQQPFSQSSSNNTWFVLEIIARHFA